MNDSTRAYFIEQVRIMPSARDINEINEFLWRPLRDELHGVKGLFCVSDPEYKKEHLPESRNFAQRCHLISFLESRRIGLIQKIGSSKPFRYTFTISFDTNYASYLNSYRSGVNLGANAAAFQSSLQYIYDYRNKLDCQCYLFENYDKLDSPEVFDTISAYYAFRFSDAAAFKANGEIAPTIIDAEIDERVHKALEIAKGSDFRTLYERARHNYLTAALCIYKMAEIGFDTRNSPKNQLRRFLTYLHEELAFIPLREMFLAYSFFAVRPRPPFFNPVQTNSTSLFKRLNAMSWDIAHLRTILDLSAVNSRNAGEGAFLIPYLLTFDQAFAALTPLIQAKALIYFEHPSRTESIYTSDYEQQIKEILGEDFESFFGQKAFFDRKKRKPPENSDWTPMLASKLQEAKIDLKKKIAK
jgi:hypothetical protein